MATEQINVARRLVAQAEARPEATAIVEPLGRGGDDRPQYGQISFQQLDHDSDRIAAGLQEMGVRPGTRLALLVRPGVDFIALVFGLLKSGAVTILIDPGMGRESLIQCLSDAEPEGFVAIPPVHAVRSLLRRRFRGARLNVTVGRRWFWGGTTLARLRDRPWPGTHVADTTAGDPAAIIFTTGSTGPPKGVLFTHGNFEAQVEQIQSRYGIQPGEVDLPGFPMFGLFNCAMGVTAVIPEMDPSRPAQVDPRRIVEAATDWEVTQTFGSPAIWNRVGRYAQQHGVRLPTVRRVLSAGAPVPVDVLRRMRDCIHPQGEMHTPYGATEALPVASISASEVLKETAERTRQGAGVCVGTRFDRVEWRVVDIVDGPIESIDQARDLPTGGIGELIVRGPQVTPRYVTRTETNRLAKISDGEGFWHRMGDAGYFDDQGRFWFCGRVAHRVLTTQGPMYPVCCEAIINEHSGVFRSALVGVGEPGRHRPVIIVEPQVGQTPGEAPGGESLLAEVRELAAGNPRTMGIRDFLLHPAFPVDIRHNAKIFREKLAVWAAEQVQ